MFCGNCGTPIPDGAAACPVCSRPVSGFEAADDRPAPPEQYYREPLPAADVPRCERITRKGYTAAVALSAVAMTSFVIYTVMYLAEYSQEAWYYIDTAWEGEFYYTIAKAILNAASFVLFFVFCLLIRKKLPLFMTAFPTYLMTLPLMLQTCASFFDFELFGIGYDYNFMGYLEFFLPFTYAVLYMIVLLLRAENTKARLILGVVTAVHFAAFLVYHFYRLFDRIAMYAEHGWTPNVGFFANWLTYLTAYICMLAAMTVIMFTSKKLRKSA